MKFRFLTTFILGFGISLSSCTQKKTEETTTVRIEVPDLSATKLKAPSSRNTQRADPPAEFSGFQCIGLNVSASDIKVTPSALETASFGSCVLEGMPKMGVVAGLVPITGGAIEVQVPSGPRRIIQVFALQTTLGRCPSMLEIADKSVSLDNIESPYEVGRTTADLQGDTNVTVQVTYAQATAKKVFCDKRSERGGLRFIQAPLTSRYLTPFSNVVQVGVYDENGELDTTASGNVSLNIQNGTAGASLLPSDGKVKPIVNGVATFPGLNVDKVGSGYAITASSDSYETIKSDPFNISGVNLQVPIQMLQMGIVSDNAQPKTYPTSRTFISRDDFDGDPQFFFEVMVKNPTSSVAAIELKKVSGGPPVATLSVPGFNNSSYKRIRGAIPRENLSNGTETYQIEIPMMTAGVIAVYSAQIIVNQTNATKTRVYLPLLTGEAGSYVGNPPNITYYAATTTTPSFSIPTPMINRFLIWERNVGTLKAKNSGSVTWRLEAIAKSGTVGTVASIALFNGASPIGSPLDVTITSTTEPISTYSSTSFSDFNAGTPFSAKIKTSNSSSPVYFYRAMLSAKVDLIDRVEVFYPLLRASPGGITGDAVDEFTVQKIEPSKCSSPDIRQHVIYKTDTSGSSPRSSLFEAGAQNGFDIPFGANGTFFDSLSLNFSPVTGEKTIMRSPGNLNLSSDKSLSSRLNDNFNPGSTINISQSFIAVGCK
jgi:hypothetical protein